MKSAYQLLSGIALVLIFSSLTEAQKRKIDVPSFDEITFNTSGNVYITQGNTTRVEVETSDERFEKLEIDVHGETLEIRQKNSSGWSSNSGSLEVFITTPDLKSISVSGSGNVTMKNKLNTGDLDLKVSGSGKIILETQAEDIDVAIAGSGNIEISGMCSTVDCQISGSGTLSGEELETNELEASISGSGECEIFVKNTIKARISGSGNVKYKGNPDKIDSKTSGSGRVRKMS